MDVENYMEEEDDQEMCPHCGQAMKGEEKEPKSTDSVDDTDEFGESIARAVVAEMRKNSKKPFENYEEDKDK